MKRLLLFLLLSVPVFPQLAFFGGGADFFSVKSSGLDNFATRYNQSRAAILTKKMESLGMLTGWYLNAGGGFGGMAVELFYSKHTGTMRAEANPQLSGGVSSRDIDLTISNFTFGTGLVVASEGNVALILPTFEANIQSISFETRAGQSMKEGDIGTVANAGIGAKLMIALGNAFAISISPSYNFNLLDASFGPLYDQTSTFYDQDRSDDYKGSFGGFHIKVGVVMLITD